jgi:hypothetical protein
MGMNRHFHGLLVEGTTGVGKSTLIDRTIRRHMQTSASRKLRSLLHLAQTHTYGPLAPAEDRGTLSVADNRAHLERIVTMLEWLHAAHDYSSIPSFAIIDTLHFTHCLRPGVVSWPDVEDFDRRLAAIGFKVLLLTGERETLRVRSIDARVGSQFLEDYARRFGNTKDEILDHFVGEQVEMDQLFMQTTMQVAHVSAAVDLDIASAAAFDFWRS